jgi:hypothetical protein
MYSNPYCSTFFLWSCASSWYRVISFPFCTCTLILSCVISCRNPSLRLATKARGMQGCGPRGRPGNHITCSLECKSVREWTLTLTNELPCWELESQMDSRIFKAWLQGSKLITLKNSLYHWKAIEMQMFKMGSHYAFGYLKHKLWPKERSGIKLTIWLPTTKSQESTQFPCV